MLFGMAQHDFINTVCLPEFISFGRIQEAHEGSELWALQFDGTGPTSGTFNSDPSQAT